MQASQALMLGGVAVGGYLLYQASQQPAAAAPAPAAPAPGLPASSVPAPVIQQTEMTAQPTVAQLTSAAQPASPAQASPIASAPIASGPVAGGSCVDAYGDALPSYIPCGSKWYPNASTGIEQQSIGMTSTFWTTSANPNVLQPGDQWVIAIENGPPNTKLYSGASDGSFSAIGSTDASGNFLQSGTAAPGRTYLTIYMPWPCPSSGDCGAQFGAPAGYRFVLVLIVAYTVPGLTGLGAFTGGLMQLTPQNIVQPMPDIAAAVQPVQVVSTPWCDLNAWVASNPAIAVLVLLGSAALLWRKR